MVRIPRQNHGSNHVQDWDLSCNIKPGESRNLGNAESFSLERSIGDVCSGSRNFSSVVRGKPSGVSIERIDGRSRNTLRLGVRSLESNAGGSTHRASGDWGGGSWST